MRWHNCIIAVEVELYIRVQNSLQIKCVQTVMEVSIGRQCEHQSSASRQAYQVYPLSLHGKQHCCLDSDARHLHAHREQQLTTRSRQAHQSQADVFLSVVIAAQEGDDILQFWRAEAQNLEQVRTVDKEVHVSGSASEVA